MDVYVTLCLSVCVCNATFTSVFPTHLQCRQLLRADTGMEGREEGRAEPPLELNRNEQQCRMAKIKKKEKKSKRKPTYEK